MTNDEIVKNLELLEQEENIRIIYACESGSRAWGFPSPDSDYDIRFLYIHPTDWYLRVFPGKDTIDIPITGDSDMGGWDLQKSLPLLKKSNCALIEWLSSPIVYKENTSATAPIKGLISSSFLPISACHHYLSMAKRKLDSVVDLENCKLKSYFYALRATLCAMHIVVKLSPPPVEIAKLIPQYLPKNLQGNYENLLSQKLANTESHRTGRQKWLEEFLQDATSEIERNIPTQQHKSQTEMFDNAFRSILQTVWKG